MLGRMQRLALGTFGLAAVIASVVAKPAVVFDSSFNLYVLGASGGSYALGTSWTSGTGTAVKLTTSGPAPPFNGLNTTCQLAQYDNATICLNADQASASTVHVFYFANTTWLALPTTGAPASLATSVSSLDHDTLTWVTYAGSSLYTLNLADLTTTPTWQQAASLPYASDISPSQALIGQSSNHYMIFGGSGLTAGQAHIYVLHYNYFQPDVQTFAAEGSGSSFPQTSGSTATQLNATTPGAFWYIPDDGTSTYLITQTDSTNSTAVYPGPSSRLAASQAAYAADLSRLVQYDFTTGSLFYIDGSSTSNPWAQIKGLTASDLVAAGASASSSSSASASASASASVSSSATASSTTPPPSSSAPSSTASAVGATSTTSMATASPTSAADSLVLAPWGAQLGFVLGLALVAPVLLQML